MNGRRKCPTCGRALGAAHEPRWRPFCSERCKLIDLGDWIVGRHRIPSQEPASADEPADEPVSPRVKH